MVNSVSVVSITVRVSANACCGKAHLLLLLLHQLLISLSSLSTSEIRGCCELASARWLWRRIHSVSPSLGTWSASLSTSRDFFFSQSCSARAPKESNPRRRLQSIVCCPIAFSVLSLLWFCCLETLAIAIHVSPQVFKEISLAPRIKQVQGYDRIQ
jgi:hypothetical protein